MKKNIFLNILTFLCLMSIERSVFSKNELSVNTPINSSVVNNFDKYKNFINNKNYTQAQKLLNNENISTAIKWNLYFAENEKNVLSMWMLANYYYENRQEQESANWFFTAALGTKLDGANCSFVTGGNIGDNILDILASRNQSMVSEARQNPFIINKAINFAINFYKKNGFNTKDRYWVCRYYFNLLNSKKQTKQNKNFNDFIISKENALINQKILYENFINKSKIRNN